MTLLQLKYIVKIVECGSMNEASHELYVSQPALSSSVKELENELGIEIFTRSSQGIALTVDGAEFLTYARQVLDQAALLEERYKNAKPRKQLCSVSTQHYMFAVEAFVEMINSIKSDEYEFTIRETRTKDIINQVANGLVRARNTCSGARNSGWNSRCFSRSSLPITSLLKSDRYR
ncbi:LysR family transcriptional regulator, partial [Bifidobacterium amazonense]